MNSIKYNTLIDWCKKDIEPSDRSMFIKGILKDENISMRELARQLNISHSTLQDWVSMRQISSEKKGKRKENNIIDLIDKLLVLIKSSSRLDDNTKRKIRELKYEMEKFDVIEI